MVFRKYTHGRYRETITMIKIQNTIKKSERTVLGLHPPWKFVRMVFLSTQLLCFKNLQERGHE